MIERALCENLLPSLDYIGKKISREQYAKKDSTLIEPQKNRTLDLSYI